MADNQESYIKRHLPGIIQCVLALYCSILATLAYFSPRQVPVGVTAPTGGGMSTTYSMPWYLWIGIVGLSLSVAIPAIIGWIRKDRKNNAVVLHPPSKLVIESATYGAIEGGGVDYPVGDFLNQITGPNGLSFEIQNDSFQVNSWNYVPEDPKKYKPKRLSLTYSYSSGLSRTIRRREGGLLVLPEDPYIDGFPLLRLDVIDAWSRLDRFFKEQEKRVLRGKDDDARAAALLYSSTPDQYLSTEYQRSIQSEIVDLHQRLVIYGADGDEQLKALIRGLEHPVYNVNCRDSIKNIMGILWQIVPKIAEDESEKDRVPGRPGSKRKL